MIRRPATYLLRKGRRTRVKTGQRGRTTLIREAFRTGTVGGLVMIPFALLFRSLGLRVNEYGRKTIEFVVGGFSRKRDRLLIGLAYGAGFYVAVNSLALPLAFGDSTPWRLGFTVVYPSFVIHLAYGFAVALFARPGALMGRSTASK